jgi:hypothetical protein
MTTLLLLLLGAAPPKLTKPVAPTRMSVPILDVAVLDGCPPEQVNFAMGTILQTIEVGAPLYNTGDHAGCYRLYLGAATDIQDRLNACQGIEDALATGISKARTAPDYTSAAWAMRDAFDGLIYVYERKLAATPAP